MDDRTVRRWDWLTAILLFLLMQVSAARLVTTNWAPFLYFSESLAAGGVVLGLAVGASRFGRRIAVLLALAYTLLVVPWLISSSSTEKLLLDRLQKVGSILLISLGQFMQRQPVKESLFFVAFVALVFWILSIAAGYWAVRHQNILVGIIPSGVIVLVIQIYANYQQRGSWWLALYLLIALLLIGRLYFLQSQRIWSERRVYINDEAWPNILGGLFMIVAAAIVMAWLLPTSISSVQAVSARWSKITQSMRDRLSNAVTSLNGPNGRPGTNFYGTSLSLGQDAAVGDSPVFTVQVVDSPASNLRYYWRARVYDNYSDGAWTTSPASNLDFVPTSGDLKVPDAEHRSAAELRFTLQFPTQNLIYAPSEPVWLDRPANVQITPVDNGVDDILSWQAKRNITNGNQYEVRAEIGNPNVEQLRAAPVSYPQWVEAHYLELPDRVRPGIQALARKVTAGQENPYDKATAITNYLRASLKYTLTVPPVPEGQDPIEWVLFNYKQGFCNYYASAEVLMLRSVGVPARLAVGFAEGQYTNGIYTVRRRDAHAWPEVFFPGLGWVEFEPTTSQQPLARSDPAAQANPSVTAGHLARPLEDGSEPGGNLPIRPGGNAGLPFNQNLAARLLVAAFSLIGITFIVYLLYRYPVLTFVPVVLTRAFESNGMATPAWILNWLHWTRLDPVEQAFAPVNWSLRWLGKTPSIDATPAERVAVLKKLMPLAVQHIETVATELETDLFSPNTADVSRARRSGFLLLLHAVRARVATFLGTES